MQPEPAVAASAALAPLAEINDLALELMALRASGDPDGLPGILRESAGLWRSLTAAQRGRLAGCPFLLVDIGADEFASAACTAVEGVRERHAEAHWFAEDALPRLSYLTLTYAWHLARSRRFAVRLVLGLSDDLADWLAALSLRQLGECLECSPCFLRLRADRPFDLRSWLRPAVFIPESKRLNVLLREFRVSHNHMAIVVDEYAGVSGLVTIEDVLEQIVGDIEDEYDFDEAEDNIRRDQFGRYRVKAQTAIEDFNAEFGTRFSDEDCDTVGGLLLNSLGRVPQRKEEIDIDDLHFVVLRADRRRLYTLLVTRLPMPHAVG